MSGTRTRASSRARSESSPSPLAIRTSANELPAPRRSSLALSVARARSHHLMHLLTRACTHGHVRRAEPLAAQGHVVARVAHCSSDLSPSPVAAVMHRACRIMLANGACAARAEWLERLTDDLRGAPQRCHLTLEPAMHTRSASRERASPRRRALPCAEVADSEVPSPQPHAAAKTSREFAAVHILAETADVRREKPPLFFGACRAGTSTGGASEVKHSSALRRAKSGAALDNPEATPKHADPCGGLPSSSRIDERTPRSRSPRPAVPMATPLQRPRPLWRAGVLHSKLED